MAVKRNAHIKPAGEVTEYTPEQIRELAKCADDPIYFITKYVQIQHPIHGAIPFNLYDYQKEMIRAYQNNRWTIVLSSRQTGKQLPLDTKVVTPDGWTTMGEIKVGDQVIGADGQPTTVSWISDITTPKVAYQLHFDTGETQIACAEHEWEVEDKNRKAPRVLTTQQMVDLGTTIGNKGESRFKIKTTKPLDLPERKLPIDPYTLGVWLGDGTARTGEITTHESDLEIIDNIDQHDGLYQRPDSSNNIRTTVYGLRTLLRESNLIQNKHIPIEYLRASYDQRLALLQGLMDTDGYVDGRGRGQCDITLANEILAKDVFHLISTLGLKPTFKQREVGRFIRYEIKFSAHSSQISVFRLTRKLKNMKVSPDERRKNSTKKRSIQKIERVESIPMRCIGVDNVDKLYLIGDSCIPTHNSITSAAYLLWYAIFNFDKTILIASNKNSNAMEMIFRIRFAYEYLPMWLKPGVKDDGWNKHNIAFDNGSRIISTATSEDSGRGLSISLLFLDEFAFVKPGVQDEFWTSISPTLSTGGSCICTSTPNGDTNIFAQLWRGAQVGANGFYPIRVRWDQPPGRDEAWKEDEIGRVGERRWRQEYECEFLSSDAMLLDSLHLQNITKAVHQTEIDFKIRDVDFYETINSENTYLVGVDPATGTGADFSAVEVFHFPSMRHVAEFRSNTMSQSFLYDVLKNLIKFIERKGSMCYFSVENNGVGQGVISLFEADEEPPQLSEFVSEEGKNKKGMTTTRKTKLRACVNMKEMIEKNRLMIASDVLLQELKTFVQKQGSYEAQTGSTDDCISAVLIVLRILEEIATYEQAAYEKLYSYSGSEWNEDDYDGGGDEYDENDLPVPMAF